jgi:flagellum-specific ATP synthase
MDRARSVVVAAPADAPPLLRMQGAAYATAVAEHFRDKGKHVLLLMDSLTRYAMAQREIALAIGEPPATKGYPPSCFAKLPQWSSAVAMACMAWAPSRRFIPCCRRVMTSKTRLPMRRAPFWMGTSCCRGRWPSQGHFPAIDIEQSASRVMHNVVSREHFELARRFRAVYSRYQKSRDLVQVGAYMSGSDPALDEAIRLQPQMAAFCSRRVGVAQRECGGEWQTCFSD